MTGGAASTAAPTWMVARRVAMSRWVQLRSHAARSTVSRVGASLRLTSSIWRTGALARLKNEGKIGGLAAAVLEPPHGGLRQRQYGTGVLLRSWAMPPASVPSDFPHAGHGGAGTPW